LGLVRRRIVNADPPGAAVAGIRQRQGQLRLNELLKNQFLPGTRDALLAIVNRMSSDDRIEGVILAGTELPLLLRGAEPPGLPFLDTTTIHVASAVAEIVDRKSVV